jgi:hypothetical protein
MAGIALSGFCGGDRYCGANRQSQSGRSPETVSHLKKEDRSHRNGSVQEGLSGSSPQPSGNIEI